MERAAVSGKFQVEQAGLVPSLTYKIESNETKPSLDSLEYICAASGITFGEFFAG
jgi:transcriptional regulator with XRE-family HTH domain